MPPFAMLADAERDALVALSLQRRARRRATGRAPTTRRRTSSSRTPATTGSSIREGYPAVQPPWGTLNAIDLNSGEIAWQIPLGEYAELTEARHPADRHRELRRPDRHRRRPRSSSAPRRTRSSARSTSATAGCCGRRRCPPPATRRRRPTRSTASSYVVIAAGGGKGTKSGDRHVAYALPVPFLRFESAAVRHGAAAFIGSHRCALQRRWARVVTAAHRHPRRAARGTRRSRSRNRHAHGGGHRDQRRDHARRRARRAGLAHGADDRRAGAAAAGEGAAPTERTEVTLLHTRDHLYIGIVAHDREPAPRHRHADGARRQPRAPTTASRSCSTRSAISAARSTSPPTRRARWSTAWRSPTAS